MEAAGGSRQETRCVKGRARDWEATYWFDARHEVAHSRQLNKPPVMLTALCSLWIATGTRIASLGIVGLKIQSRVLYKTMYLEPRSFEPKLLRQWVGECFIKLNIPNERYGSTFNACSSFTVPAHPVPIRHSL